MRAHPRSAEDDVRKSSPNLIPAFPPLPYPRVHPTAFGREQARAGILFAEGERNGVPAGSVSLGDRCRRGSKNPVQPVLRCAQGWWHQRFEKGAHPRGPWRVRCVASVSAKQIAKRAGLAPCLPRIHSQFEPTPSAQSRPIAGCIDRASNIIHRITGQQPHCGPRPPRATNPR